SRVITSRDSRSSTPARRSASCPICPRNSSASSRAVASRRCSSSISDPINRLLTLTETVGDTVHPEQPNNQLLCSITPSTRAAPNSFSAERAVSPLDGSELWVVLDPELVPHREASDFLRALHGAGHSPHTIRVYAGR